MKMLVIYQCWPEYKKMDMNVFYCGMNWYSLLWSAMGECLSKLNMYILHDLGTPLAKIVHAGKIDKWKDFLRFWQKFLTLKERTLFADSITVSMENSIKYSMSGEYFWDCFLWSHCIHSPNVSLVMKLLLEQQTIL